MWFGDRHQENEEFQWPAQPAKAAVEAQGVSLKNILLTNVCMLNKNHEVTVAVVWRRSCWDIQLFFELRSVDRHACYHTTLFLPSFSVRAFRYALPQTRHFNNERVRGLQLKAHLCTLIVLFPNHTLKFTDTACNLAIFDYFFPPSFLLPSIPVMLPISPFLFL